MKLVLRILFSAAFIGSLYWIRVQHAEPEPYISTILSVAALLGTFYEPTQKIAKIIPRLVRRGSFGNGRTSYNYFLCIHNDGDEEIKDLSVIFNTRPGQESPVYESDNPIRISSLHPGQKHETVMALTFGTGTEFDIEWCWRTASGKLVERKGILVPEGE